MTQTNIAIAWNASSNNVDVAGYGLYLNGAQVGTTSGLTYTFGG